VPDVVALIAGRLLQGAGAALLTPMVLALLNEVYDGPRRLRALGIYATFLALPAVSGQLIGGLLIRADIAGLGWRAIFLVNVPVGLVVAVVAPRILPRSRANGTRALDLPSLGLVVGAATGILLPLLEGRQLGWPAWTWISLAGGLLLAVLVLWRSRALADAGLTPLIDPAALRSASVRRGLLGQALLFLGMASYFLVLAMYLQQGHGLSPLASGLVFTILAAAYVVGARCVDALNARLGRMTLPVAALAFTVGHMTLFAAVELHGTTGSVLWLAPGLVVTGLAMGVCLRALIAAVMGGVEPRHAAAVSGVLSAVQQLSNSLGVALIGLVFFGPANLDHAFARSLLALAAGTTALAAVTALGTRRPSAAR
jgi:MFS family permease